MVDLQKKETIKKRHNHYLHTTQIIYPIENYLAMTKSWSEAITKYEDWLGKYDEHVKMAEETAVKSFEIQIQEHKDNIEKVDAMSDEEKLKYWKENFEKEKEAVKEAEVNKEKIIAENIETNKKMLDNYKKSYEQEMKNKKEALKRWTKV